MAPDPGPSPGLGELGSNVGEEGVGGAAAFERWGVERRRLSPHDEMKDERLEMDMREEIESGRGAALISCRVSPRSRSFASATCS